MHTRHTGAAVALGVALTALTPAAHAQGRLVATGGVTQIEGAAGGGIVPWALVAGYGTRDEIGATAFGTAVNTQNFRLRVFGGAVGFYDRVEVSFAEQRLNLGSTVPGKSLTQDVIGLKVRLAGDRTLLTGHAVTVIDGELLACP